MLLRCGLIKHKLDLEILLEGGIAIVYALHERSFRKQKKTPNEHKFFFLLYAEGCIKY